jgi:hypothetical protein
MPRRSSDNARQTLEENGKDRLIGDARRQVDFELRLQLVMVWWVTGSN